MDEAVLLTLPFAGWWLVQNSPARRVPSHGADLLGERYAVDFVGVDERRRTAPVRDWRTFLASEPPERFFAFGRPILAPVDGTVVAVHDGEPDHAARRSPIALVPYMLGQAGRLRDGIGAVAGNYAMVEDRRSGMFVTVVHLRAESLRVAEGNRVRVGQPLAECGNSGNSTQPHVHVQVTDRSDLLAAEGVPMAFRDFREWPRRETRWRDVESGMPGEGSVIEARLVD